MADDRLRAAWRRHFSPLLHPHVPLLQSLAEAADKLDAARGFLEPLSPDTEAEREQGMVVASLAIDYALKLLEHHALIDGPDPPLPVNLAQAKQAVANLLAVVREYVELGRVAEGHATSDAEGPGGADARIGEGVPAHGAAGVACPRPGHLSAGLRPDRRCVGRLRARKWHLSGPPRSRSDKRSRPAIIEDPTTRTRACRGLRESGRMT